jgi:HK97 family phage portal protein
MNGKDFLYKIRVRLELDNTAFVYIKRDDTGKVVALYPMPKANHQALDLGGKLYIEFRFANGQKMVCSWEDLAVLRKDYSDSDVFGATNAPIMTTLDLLTTTQQGLKNAIESTANLRGIIKSTKSMLKPGDLKTIRDKFVEDYMSISNEGGIAALDSTQDFDPISLTPHTANYKHIEELRNNVYRYFGVNDNILMSKAVGDDWQAFYEARLEPFLIALGIELTNKVFTDRERGFGNQIIFESNRMQYMSVKDKLNLVQMADRGIMTPNEIRRALNLAPLDGGDVPIRRLDTKPVDEDPKKGDDDATKNE